MAGILPVAIAILLPLLLMAYLTTAALATPRRDQFPDRRQGGGSRGAVTEEVDHDAP
jgi:hypothetical protein